MAGRPPSPCVALAFLMFTGGTFAAPVPQSISTSRQFIVYGSDLGIRGAICDLAEQTKRELLAVLRQEDDWSIAIVVNAQYPRANLPELPPLKVDLAQTGSGLKFQLDLVLDPAVSRPEIRRELLRVLTLEMIYRAQPQLPSGATYVAVPAWFLAGIPSENFDLSRERVAALLKLSAGTGNVWPLHKFLAQRVEVLDAATRDLYCAYSLALVDLLNHRAVGRRHLKQFILDLPRAPNNPMEDLRDHFPEIFGTESAEVIWQRQIASFSSDQPYQLLSVRETERRLDKMLRITVSDRAGPRSYELTQFRAFAKDKVAARVFPRLMTDLRVLASRAHPIYGPVIAQYAQIVSSLRRGRTGAVSTHLGELASTRRAISAQMRGIDDYLNWFEATRRVRPSGEFADYMKAAERAAHPQRTKRDSISLYLNAAELQLGEEEPLVR